MATQSTVSPSPQVEKNCSDNSPQLDSDNVKNEDNDTKNIMKSERLSGKLVAHIEPYGLEPLMRSRSRKGKGFYDESVPLIVDETVVSKRQRGTSKDVEVESKDTVPIQTNKVEGHSKLQKYLRSLDKFIETKEKKAQEELKCRSDQFPLASNVKNPNTTKKLSRSSSLDSVLCSRRPENPRNMVAWKSNTELASLNMRTSNEYSSPTFNNPCLLQDKTTSPKIHNEGDAVKKENSARMDSSADDKSSTSEEIYGSMKQSDGLLRKKRLSEEDCYKFSSSLDKFHFQEKKKRRGKDGSSDAVLCSFDKKRHEETEQEKGKRLAQEIPGFNWLEQKIRNKSDRPTCADGPPIVSEKDPATSPKSSSSSSSDSSKVSSKPLPALIPSSQFSVLTKAPAAGSGMSKNGSSSNFFKNSRPSDQDAESGYGTFDSDDAHKSDKAEETRTNNEQDSSSVTQTKVEECETGMGSVKRHLQAALPPLLPSSKVSAIRSSTDISSSSVLRKPFPESLRPPSKVPSPASSPIPVDNVTGEDCGRLSSPDNSSTNGEQPISVCQKMNLLTTAFQEKLSNYIKTSTSESSNFTNFKKQTDDSSFPPPDKTEKKAHLPESKETDNPNNVFPPEPHEIPEKDIKKKYSSQAFHDCLLEKMHTSSGDEDQHYDNQMRQLLQKVLTEEVDTKIVMAAVLSEVIQTRQEIQKLRAVQEKVLRDTEYSRYKSKTSPSFTITGIKPQMDEDRPFISPGELVERKKRSCEAEIIELEDREDQKRSMKSAICEPISSKKLRMSNSPPQDPNAIMIHYTLPSSISQPPSHIDSTNTSHFRSYLGIHSNSLDVVPIDSDKTGQTRSYIDRNGVSLTAVTRAELHGSGREPPQGVELMKLLENGSAKYSKPALPDLPNLIPSRVCYPSPYRRLSDGQSIHEPSVGSSIMPVHSSESSSRSLDNRKIRDSRMSVPEARQLSAPMPLTIIKEVNSSRAGLRSPKSPSRFPENSHHVVSPFQNAQLDSRKMESGFKQQNDKGNVPAPQTFQPRILIHSQEKEELKMNNPEWRFAPSPAQLANRSVTSFPHKSQQNESSRFESNQQPLQPRNPPQGSFRPNWNGGPTKPYDSLIPHQQKIRPQPPIKHLSTVRPLDIHSAPPLSNSRAGFYYVPGGYQGKPYPHSSMNPHVSGAPTPVRSSSSGHIPSMYVQIPKPMMTGSRPENEFPKNQDSDQGIISVSHSANSKGCVDERSVIMSMASHGNTNRSPENLEAFCSKGPSYKLPIDNMSSSKPSSHYRTPEETVKKISDRKCFIQECDQLAQFLCSGCKLAWYCSKGCQQKHWSTHSSSCMVKR